MAENHARDQLGTRDCFRQSSLGLAWRGELAIIVVVELRRLEMRSGRQRVGDGMGDLGCR